MIIVKKIKKFLKKDIRSKLIFLKLYPKFFHQKGIKSIYSKFVFSRILKERFTRFKRDNYKKFFIERNVKEKNNFLFSLPRSGSTATRLMLISYFEMLYGIGNGIPKYDPINDKWIFPLSIIQHEGLHNSLFFENLTSNMERKPINLYLSNEEFQKKKVIFSRYPISNSDTYNTRFSKPAVLIRDPKEQIISYCVNINFSKENLSQNNLEIVKKAYNNYRKFIKYWQREFENKTNNKDYILLNFKNIVSNPKEVLECLIKFYGYEINNELIKRASEIHQKNNTLEYLKYVKVKKIRFTDPAKKKKLEEEIVKTIEIFENKSELEMLYNSFVEKFCQKFI
tara:strand:- start:699 stop:1715 length:1017 start_codon:yes stop_codon:yes gene_type:complete